MTTRKSLSCAARLRQIANELMAEVVDDWDIDYIQTHCNECYRTAGEILLKGSDESQLPAEVSKTVRQAKLATVHMHERVRPRAVFLELSESLSPIEIETITIDSKIHSYSKSARAHQGTKRRREVVDEAADRLYEVAEWIEDERTTTVVPKAKSNDSAIPPEKRTRKMNKRDALHYLGKNVPHKYRGGTGRAALKWLNECIKADPPEIRYERLNRTLGYFHVDNFPAEVRDHIS